jgi:hypothetical protein
MAHHRAIVTSPRPVGRGSRGHHAAVGSLDLRTALDFLARAVRQRGRDFVYQPTWVEEPRYLTCRYADHGAPGCVVGHVLAQAGVGVHALEALRDDGVDDLYTEGRLPVQMTLGALAVLRAAQQSQDRGCCWGDVLAHATAVAVRVMDVMPDAALVSAAAAHRPQVSARAVGR